MITQNCTHQGITSRTSMHHGGWRVRQAVFVRSSNSYGGLAPATMGYIRAAGASEECTGAKKPWMHWEMRIGKEVSRVAHHHGGLAPNHDLRRWQYERCEASHSPMPDTWKGRCAARAVQHACAVWEAEGPAAHAARRGRNQ
jgi:hypothetical protein